MASTQFQALLANLRAQPPRHDMSVEALREAGQAKAAQYPVPDDVRCEPVDAGGVPAEWIQAAGAGSERTLLYLHGGGYYRGAIATVRELCGRISRAAGLRVLAPGYRLAPENPFPAAVEDALAAWRWLLATGHDPARMAVAGDSAGGGLTCALLVFQRQHAGPLPGAAVCLSPWVDLAHTGESMDTLAETDPSLSRAYLERFAAMYLGDADPRDPLASPLYADLAGLPPLLVQVGTAEVLLDDSVRLAEKARAAGVAVELERWEGLTHVWQNNGPDLPESNAAIAHIAAFLGQHLR